MPTILPTVSRAASLALEAVVKPSKDLTIGGVDRHLDKHVRPNT
jgi:hypothetical protein